MTNLLIRKKRIYPLQLLGTTIRYRKGAFRNCEQINRKIFSTLPVILCQFLLLASPLSPPFRRWPPPVPALRLLPPCFASSAPSAQFGCPIDPFPQLGSLPNQRNLMASLEQIKAHFGPIDGREEQPVEGLELANVEVHSGGEGYRKKQSKKGENRLIRAKWITSDQFYYQLPPVPARIFPPMCTMGLTLTLPRGMVRVEEVGQCPGMIPARAGLSEEHEHSEQTLAGKSRDGGQVGGDGHGHVKVAAGQTLRRNVHEHPVDKVPGRVEQHQRETIIREWN